MAHTIGGIAATSSIPTKVAAGDRRYGGPIFRQKPSIRSALRRLLRFRAWLGFATAADEAEVLALPADLVEPVVEPRFGIDGWTFQGTVLEERFSGAVEAELAPLVHAMCAGVATAWTYERAARLMEQEEAYSQAYAVLEAAVAGGVTVDAGLVRWRGRLAATVLRFYEDS
jgi:hypothetical protein